MFGKRQARAPLLHGVGQELNVATELIESLSLPRLLRLTVAGSIPPLWYEIAVLHCRGGFHSRFMWGPLAYLPLHMVAGIASGVADTRATRQAYRALSWGTCGLGLFGTLMHLRGVRRQMGGFYEWRHNIQTGPPVVAPPLIALFGLVGVLGGTEQATPALVRRLRLLNVADELLLATEVGYSHYQNYFANPLQYTPLVLGPALAVAHLTAESRIRSLQRAGRRLERALSAAALLAGMIGFGFHVKSALHRTGGLSWQNLFYGPPLVAPMQLSGQGIFGLLASLFDRRRAG